MAKAKKRLKAKTNSNKSLVSPAIIGIAVLGAVLIVAGLIFLGNQTRGVDSSSVDISKFPTKGDPNAPVTIIEFSDYG